MSKNKRNKYPKNWLQLRIVILVRDKFTCTICGNSKSYIRDEKGKKISLHVMHLDGNSFNNVFTLAPPYFGNPNNNLASGCPSCHKLYDAQLGNKHNQHVVKNKQNINLSNINL